MGRDVPVTKALSLVHCAPVSMNTSQGGPMADTRGLVISPPIELSNRALYVKSSTLDPQELRFSLLFWDKLDYPENSLLKLPPGDDAEFLISAGILQRTRVDIQSGEMADAFRRAHVETFRKLDKAEAGTWSIATGERSISFLDEELDEGRGALVAIHRAIPVPNQDVPLQDVLAFRERRRAELLALRHHLESIYRRVVNAGDGALALKSEVEALDLAVSNYVNSIRGLGMSWRWASLSANLNLPAGTLVGLGAYQANLSAVEAVMTAAAAMVAVNVGVSLRGSTATATPFRFVSAYHEELFRPG